MGSLGFLTPPPLPSSPPQTTTPPHIPPTHHMRSTAHCPICQTDPDTHYFFFLLAGHLDSTKNFTKRWGRQLKIKRNKISMRHFHASPEYLLSPPTSFLYPPPLPSPRQNPLQCSELQSFPLRKEKQPYSLGAQPLRDPSVSLLSQKHAPLLWFLWGGGGDCGRTSLPYQIFHPRKSKSVVSKRFAIALLRK